MNRLLRCCPTLLLLSIFWLSSSYAHGQTLTRESVLTKLAPYQGESAAGVDTRTLTGKVMTGYQGWFATPTDGASLGWKHYSGRGGFEPGRCSIDLWPDVSELDADERYDTPFRHADGTAAQVFSSYNRKTVVRHFRWMREYGIDGAFVQRFATQTFNTRRLNHCNTVLSHCREGANQNGRAYAVMYDLSGLRADQMDRVMDDWRSLVDRMRIGRDANDRAYLHHRGKPVVAVWGIGFNDDRKYTLDECAELLELMQNDKRYGGFTVMLGVPTGWRTLDRDAIRDEQLLEIIGRADIISPWTIGRFRTPAQVERFARLRWQPDLAWCQQRGKDYLPVVFPGFSWHNMKPDSPLGLIPRLKGDFLWKQYTELRKTGATMVYQAMFDEVDEATAIFKCTDDPPTGKSKFLTNEGLPSDHYLWLTGKGGQLIRQELPLSEEIPERTK